MSRIVMKFGGTSVGSVERINHVADIVRSEVDAKNQVVVVLSAMAGETDRLVNLTKDLSKDFSASEYDVIISSGEQVSVGALSGLLNSLGVKSQSLLGWQVPIVTSSYHKSSRIEAISSKVILKLLEEKQCCNNSWLSRYQLGGKSNYLRSWWIRYFSSCYSSSNKS